jgi:SOS-response transcriptional repressor LexA
LFVSQPYGQRIRLARLERGLSQDDLADRAKLSKSYISLIENDRLNNPPADAKLRRIETALGFAAGELVHEAHLARTPEDIRTVLATLAGGGMPGHVGKLDSAYLNGLLQRAVEAKTANVDRVPLASVPVINHVSAGGLSEFSDLSHPKAVADQYVGCPDVADPNAFAARVSGDSMAPKYAAGDVVVFSPAAEVRDGDDCYVRLEDGQTTFKRVYFETAEDGTPSIRLQPRNGKYQPRVGSAEQVAGIFRAVYRYQALSAD